MKRYFRKRRINLNDINERVVSDAAGFIVEESERYQREIEKLARYLAVGFDNHCLVMLSGPSSSEDNRRKADLLS